MKAERPGYYAIIPADVRYDDSIPPNAKLLYGEISALMGPEGFCYASNQYFSGLYGMAEETITRLITRLEQAGHIVRVLERDKSGQIKVRKLYPQVPLPELKPPEENDPPSPRKNREGTEEKRKDTKPSKSNTPHSPPGGKRPPKRSDRGCREHARVLPERFEGFWQFYRSHISQGCTAGNRQKAIRAWDRLAPDDALATAMAKALSRQVRSAAWASGVGVPHASTWLNNRGWEDDWGPVETDCEGRKGEWL